MLLWLMILVSVLFAYVGHQKGFFVMFATLFNLMFAIFIAVLSTPKLMSFSAGYERSGYYAAMSVFLLCVLVFGVLEFFACLYFLRDCEGLFPKLFDKIGAVIFGFLSGYILCCLVFFVFCVMPCSAERHVEKVCARDRLEELSVPCVRKVCNFLAWYSLHCFEGNSEKAITYLLTLDEKDSSQDNTLLDRIAPTLTP
jgi:uncharacterized membrane protein required for colicin V production